jgi:pilus assembly protein CpaB
LLVVAVGCGLVAAFMVHHLSVKPGADTDAVLVAAVDMPQGTLLDEKNIKDWIKVAQLPKGAIPLNAIKEEKEMLGKVVGRPLSANTILTEPDFANVESLVRRMEPGYVAITVRATQESSHAGFVLPGSRVDILCTVNPSSSPQSTLSRIFLRNVKILAANAHTDRPKDMSTVPIPVTVTLQVKPEEAERVNWVSSKGIVNLLLRKPDDTDVGDTRGATSPFKDGEGVKDPTVPTVMAMVATRNIEEGESLDAGMFEEKRFQRGQLPDDPFLDKANLAGLKMGRFPLAKGQVLTMTNLNRTGFKDESEEHVMTIAQGLKTESHVFKRVKKPDQGPPATPEPAPAPPRRAPDGERG